MTNQIQKSYQCVTPKWIAILPEEVQTAVQLKSYENTKSAGEVQIVGVSSEELFNLKGKNVLVIEDMIDTGKTMQKLLKTLR